MTLRLLGGASLSGPDGPVGGRAAQRRRLALVAVLAGARGQSVSRDRIVALFWPEAETDQARHLLRDSLYVLRSALGDDVIVATGDDLRLNGERVTTDVAAFEGALAAGEADRAVALYAGPFLDGVHVRDAPEFERWADGERVRLAARYTTALEQLATAADARRDHRASVEWWRRLASYEPLNGRAALGLARALAAAGDRAEAMRHVRRHAAQLAEELGAQPDGALLAFAARLRAGDGEAAITPPGAPIPSAAPRGAIDPPPRAPAAPLATVPVSASDTGNRARWWARRRAVVTLSLAMLAVAGTLALRPFLVHARTAARRGRDARLSERLTAEAARAFEGGDRSGMHRLVLAAIAADSTAPWPWYWLGRLRAAAGEPGAEVAARHAARLAAGRDERARLHALALALSMEDDPARLEVARRLYAQYPNDPGAGVRYGDVLLADGRFLDAVGPLRRAVALDAAGVDAGRVGSPGVEAMGKLASAYLAVDSLAAAERLARGWLARQPDSPLALYTLGGVLMATGRDGEALALMRDASAAPREGDPGTAVVAPERLTETLIGVGRLAEADSLLRPLMAVGTFEARRSALWYHVLVLRNQRRYADALAEARELRRLARADGAPPWTDALVEAQVLLEAGDPRAAAALWDSIASPALYRNFRPSAAARARVLGLTNAAGALAAAGDTAMLAERADTIEALGRQEAYERDRRMHRYVRGLLLAARGDHAAAVAEYRQAVFMPAYGYTRVNLALARSLRALGRHEEAIWWLRAAARGGVVSNNYYVTRTDAYAALAEAYRAAGRADSAAAYLARVRRAVGRAHGPVVTARVAAAPQR